jgi:hypothetical protein
MLYLWRDWGEFSPSASVSAASPLTYIQEQVKRDFSYLTAKIPDLI